MAVPGILRFLVAAAQKQIPIINLLKKEEIMSVIRNLEIPILSVLFLFAGTGCVITEEALRDLRGERSTSSESEVKEPEFYFADIKPLRSIDNELKRDKN